MCKTKAIHAQGAWNQQACSWQWCWALTQALHDGGFLIWQNCLHFHPFPVLYNIWQSGKLRHERGLAVIVTEVTCVRSALWAPGVLDILAATPNPHAAPPLGGTHRRQMLGWCRRWVWEALNTRVEKKVFDSLWCRYYLKSLVTLNTFKLRT